MTDKELKDILAKGTHQQFSFDPNLKTEINRSTLDAVMREVRKGLSSKRKLSVVVVKD